jgi:hypothetical protein
MDNFEKVMSSWQEALNSDQELKERNRNISSTLEGKTALQLEVAKKPPQVIEVQDGKFTIHQGSVRTPLLKWTLSLDLFKDIMLGKYRVVYGLLDPRGEVSFDSENFTHWNGASIIEMLLLAQELAVRDGEVSRLVRELGE